MPGFIGRSSQNLRYNIFYGPHWGSAPIGLQQGFMAAVNWLQDNIFIPVTIAINVDYGFCNGSTVTGTGETQQGNQQDLSAGYSQVRAGLQRNARSAIAQEAFRNSFPSSDPTSGATMVVNSAYMRILGLWESWPANMSGTTPDAYHGFGTGNWFYGANGNPATFNDAFGVCMHELTEGLCRWRSSFTLGGFCTALGLMSYTSPGVVQTGNSSLTTSYFSVDGGVTNLRTYSTAGDPMDWNGTPNDCFQATAVSGTQPFSQPDKWLLDAIGCPSIPNPP